MPSQQANADTQVVISGRFEIKERLSGGGLSRLYRALDRETNAPVVIKVLDPEWRGGSNEEWPRRLMRFRREARILERLSKCPQVVNFVAADTACPLPWIAMDFLSGRTLRSLIDDDPGSLSLPRFLHLASEIVHGLSDIHRESILHRDLCPENILAIRDKDRSVHVRFLDFGIGKPLTDDNLPVTQMPTIMGKPAYLAPEQTRGEYGAGSDVYALGVILYEMLTGDLPLRISSFAEVARIRKEEPLPLAAHATSRRVPEELRALIMACLAKDCADRPTLDELAECLDELKRRHESGEDLTNDFSEWEISRLDNKLNNTRTILEPRVDVGHFHTEWLISSHESREVWLAKDKETDEEISLVLQGGDPRLKAMYLGALRSAKALAHENVQGVHDYGETEDFVWGALELVRGSTLEKILDDGKPLPPGQILQIGQGILEALNASHDAGIQHGRLTPSCVLLDEFDTVKLAGLGSDASMIPPDCITTHGAQAAWLSPESLLGTKPTIPSDLYSFGCLLQTMITTESPFEGSDMAQAYHHVNDRPAEVLVHRPDFQPRDLSKVVEWLLQKDPDRRPQSAARLLKAFLRCFSKNEEPPQMDSAENPPSPDESARRWWQRIWPRRHE